MRRHPAYVHPQMARGLVGPRNIIRLRRMEFNQENSAPQPSLQNSESPTARIYRLVAAGNIDRIRRGWSRSHLSPFGPTGPIIVEYGTVHQVPSDD